MSSPFAYFRKRQKAMIVLLGIICMVAFVFLGVPLDNLRGPGGANLTVATTKYGTIHESDMMQMGQSRAVVNEFLQRLAILTIDAMQREGMEPNLLRFRASMLQRQLNELMSNTSETAVVDMMILSHKAEEMGIVVSDARINQFIRALTQDKVTSDQIRNLLAQMDVSQGRIFEGLRQELLAREVRMLSLDTMLATAPPGLRWDYYRRLNERISAEMVPIRVADFVGLVEDPSQTELQAFFERYKDREAVPNSPDPGFHQPERGKFQYYRADFDTFLNQATASITAEEVQAYYDANREQFPYSELPAEPQPDEPTEEEPDEDGPAMEAPDEEPAMENAEDEETSEAAEPEPAADDVPAETEQPVEEPAAEPPAEADQPTPEGDEAAAILAPLQATEYLLALAQDEEPTGPLLGVAEEVSPSEDSEDSSEPVESSDEALAESGDPPVSSEEAANTPTTEDPADAPVAEPEPAMTEEVEIDVDDLVVPQSITDFPQPRYEPLEKVEGQIRRQLASQRANELIDQAFAKLTEQMNAFYDENYEVIDAWRTAREKNSSEVPTLPQFDVRAAASGMEGISYDQTALLSARDIQELTDLGRSTATGNVPFAQMAFSSLRLFTPKQSQDFSGNRYLFWKIEETKEFVPTLDQIRDQVVEAWKLRAARDLARKRANELADQARSAGKPLRETFGGTPGLEVLDSGTFTWMTYGTALPFSTGQPPRLSEVRGVPDAGHSFMRDVFSLDAGEVGVAFNSPETIAYVVRVASIEPAEAVLREMFMADRFQSYASAALGDIEQVRDTWERHMREEAGLDWARMPRESFR